MCSWGSKENTTNSSYIPHVRCGPVVNKTLFAPCSPRIVIWLMKYSVQWTIKQELSQGTACVDVSSRHITSYSCAGILRGHTSKTLTLRRWRCTISLHAPLKWRGHSLVRRCARTRMQTRTQSYCIVNDNARAAVCLDPPRCTPEAIQWQ